MTDDIIPGVAAPESYAFEYVGRGREMVPIILVNLVLTIVTLGIFRFWGRTRVRRYVWSSTRFMGDSFEYTGKGLELFIGFVIILVTVLLPMGYLIFEAQTMMITPGQETMGLALFMAFYPIFFFLYGLAIYRRNKYRLSRPQWRGIRGAQHEAGLKYAAISFGLLLLTFVTVGLAIPYVANRLWAYEQNRRDFGSGRFSYNASSGPLYKRFILTSVITLVIFAIGLSLMFNAVIEMQGIFDVDPDTGMPSTNADAASDLFLTVFLFYFGIAIAAGPVMLWYAIKQLEHFMGNMRFENAGFSFHGTYGGLLKVWIVNLLIIIFSLGLASEIAEMRMIRFVVQNLRLTGDIDVESILQTALESPKIGEGLAEGFDLGGI